MDIKPWEYADFPAFNEPVPGATRVPTTGDEIGVKIGRASCRERV